MKPSEQFPSPREYIAGVPCDFLSQERYEEAIRTALSQEELTHIVTLNAEMVVRAQTDTIFKHAIEQSELIIPDSSGVVWAREYTKHNTTLFSFFFSHQKPLTGIDSIFLICKEIEHQRGRAYLIGGEESDRAITETLLRNRYPALNIQSLADSQDFTTLPKTIPSAIFVAFGAPKQTMWINEHRTELEHAGIRIAIGIGGAFAMISGRLPRAPKWMRAAHLEWLWRLALEPKRIKRIWNAVVTFPRIISGYPH